MATTLGAGIERQQRRHDVLMPRVAGLIDRLQDAVDLIRLEQRRRVDEQLRPPEQHPVHQLS